VCARAVFVVVPVQEFGFTVLIGVSICPSRLRLTTPRPMLLIHEHQGGPLAALFVILEASGLSKSKRWNAWQGL
jgi:hypothetical protein